MKYFINYGVAAATFLVTATALADATRPLPAAAGVVRIEVGARSYQGSHVYKCPAILVAGDTAVASAHCFDWLWVGEGIPPIAANIRANFVADDGRQVDAAVTRWVRHPAFEVASCLHAPISAPCQAALAWCRLRSATLGLSVAACDAQVSSLAKAFGAGGGPDLALIFFDRVIEGVCPMALASDEAGWLARATGVDVFAGGLWWLTGAAANPHWQVLPLCENARAEGVLSLASITADGTYDGSVGLATVSAADAPEEPLLLALPSHFGPLSDGGPRAAEAYVYQRVAPESAWLREEMRRAGERGERVLTGEQGVLRIVSVPHPPQPPPAPPTPDTPPAPPTPGPAPAPAPPTPGPPPAPPTPGPAPAPPAPDAPPAPPAPGPAPAPPTPDPPPAPPTPDPPAIPTPPGPSTPGRPPAARPEPPRGEEPDEGPVPPQAPAGETRGGEGGCQAASGALPAACWGLIGAIRRRLRV